MGWMTISVLLFCLQESVRWLKTLYYNSIRCRHHEKAAKDEFYGINKTSKRVLLDNYWCSDTATGLFPHPIDAIISCLRYCLRSPFSTFLSLIQYLSEPHPVSFTNRLTTANNIKNHVNAWFHDTYTFLTKFIKQAWRYDKSRITGRNSAGKASE